jgi:UDP-N-acetyl-D-galactosamine dehydrogenase
MKKQQGENQENTIAVVGLGYVGLPLLIALGKHFPVIGYDVDPLRISELSRGIDRTEEAETSEVLKYTKCFTTSPSKLNMANFIIITVPTPVDDFNVPDLTLLRKACEVVGENMMKGAIVVFESTVYPGVTEEICKNILEKVSGFKCDIDFAIGYSPERINPGDRIHTLSRITKVVSASNNNALEKLQSIYGKIVDAGLHLTQSIKVAEAAKIIENTQRDVNIALMNELAQLFAKMDIPIDEVLEAASTKWNFLNFTPGLVGGHCIGVDPYYLEYSARRLNFHTQMITAGRKINDQMHIYYAKRFISVLLQKNLQVHNKVLILGCTFKENCPDIRNSRVFPLIKELETYNLAIEVYDPWVDKEYIHDVKNLRQKELNFNNYAGIILAVPHEEIISLIVQKYQEGELSNAFVYDLKSKLPKLIKCLRN